MRIPQILLFSMLIMGLLSCQQKTITNVATADVFIKSILYQGDTLYGVAHSVFSYNRIKQVSVTDPQRDTLLLPSQSDHGISFYKDPSIANGDYTVFRPSPGVYSYRITFNDNTQSTLTNSLGANYLVPATIDSVGLSPDGQSFVLTWNPVSQAQGYQIRIFKGNTDIIPARTYFQLSPLRVQFPVSTFQPFLPGTINVELDALLFESDAHQQLQAISVSTATVTIP